MASYKNPNKRKIAHKPNDEPIVCVQTAHGPAHARMQSRLHTILSLPLTREGQGLYSGRTRKVCMLHSSGSKGKDKVQETQKSFLTATHVL